MLKKIDARILLCVFAAVLVAGLWTITLLQLRTTRQVIIDNTQRDVRSLARLFNEHANRTVESADQAVTYLRFRYNTLGTGLDIAQDLKVGLNPDSIYNLFSIVDEHGDVVLSSQPFKPINLSDREHVKVHAGADSGELFISRPVLGRVSKKWSIQMTRRINYPDGRFKGVVVVSMDPQYFIRLYNDIDVGKYDVITLVGTDGVVRVRRVGDQVSMGMDVSASPFFQLMQKTGRGVTTAVSTIDGRERIQAYETLQHYPLVVTVGADIEERLAPYYVDRNQSLLIAAVISAVIALFTASIIILVGRLMASREKAIAASLAKSRFLSNMSHELRTPLNGILGFSEVMVEELGSQSLHGGFAQAIHGSGVRLLALVDATLELSALESGTIVLAPQPENLALLLQHATAPYLAAAAAKQLALDIEIDPATPATLVCDRVRLLMVLDKLLDNAMRHTDAGTILVSARPGGTGLELTVRDSGCGVPAHLQEQIFERFSQADDSAARSSEGAGLGLAIARHLVELMDGELTLKSFSGQGAQFSVTLRQH
ncbi:ATP-binding protein [Actimicrobium sp. CCC2.4]|uniref:sensor histidine kinase n=1 Tax=Actimicrobium sp. CCC2.4 TaxID=3048606 RepID=UPI002AC969A2|nr:ATP-binding protein [Actimicrobium sp. CCC2.4]MEB0133734.1 ATP-binding protein [Actimicrobium sp. CCC2.4]WPX31280.1 ATP-binding protein [Actimicrobium sp. CCC2.4]